MTEPTWSPEELAELGREFLAGLAADKERNERDNAFFGAARFALAYVGDEALGSLLRAACDRTAAEKPPFQTGHQHFLSALRGGCDGLAPYTQKWLPDMLVETGYGFDSLFGWFVYPRYRQIVASKQPT